VITDVSEKIVTLKMAAATFSKMSKAAGKINRCRKEEHVFGK
jgi:hypothetical protein